MADIPWDQIERDYQSQTKHKKWNPAEVMSKIRRSDYESALADLKVAIEEHPSNEKLINLYVHCLRRNSHSIMDIQSAKTILENFTNSHKAGDLTIFNMGTLYMDLEQYEKALEQFEKVYSTDPSNSKVIYNIALCNHYLLREDKALSYYQQAIKLGNRSKKALLNCSVLLSKLNRKKEAKSYLDELQKQYGDDPKVINNINVFLGSENDDKATMRRNFELIHEKNFENTTITYNEAVFEYHETNLETSAKLFQKVDDETIDTDPLKIFARLNCAVVFEKLNKTKEARRFYLKIIDQLGRFIDVSDIQQRMMDLQNPTGVQQQQSSQKKKKSGRSSLIAYDSDLMEFKNNFSMGEDLRLARDYSSLSQKSPISMRDDQSNRRGSNDGDSPTLFKSEIESSRFNNLEHIKGEDEEEKSTKRRDSENQPKQDSSFEKGNKSDRNLQEAQKTERKENTPIKENELKNIQPENKSNSVDINYEGWTKEDCLEKIKVDPQNYEANLRLGLIYLEEKSYAGGIEYFKKCLELKPVEQQELAVKSLTDCYIYSGEFEKAMNAVENLPKTKSAVKSDYLMRKGLAYEGLGNVKEAKTLLVQATTEDPNNSLTHLRLGSLLIRQDKMEEGIVSLRKACELNPSSFETRIKLAEALMMGGDDYINEALKHFKYVYDLDKNDYDALIGLSQVYEKRGDTQLAIEYAETASNLPEAPIDCFFFLGTLYYKQKDLKKAEDLFRKVLKKEIGHVGAAIELATILVVNKEFEKARKYFKHALKIDPENPTANMRYGKILQTHFGEYDEAIECYRKVIAADDTQYKAHYQIGLAYAEKKQYNQAHQAFKACIDINSKYGPAWRGVGQILFESNKVQEALKHFQKALEVDHDDVEAMTQIGNCYYEMQDFDSAITWYEKIVKVEKSANILYNIGNCYFMKEGYEKSIEYYNQSIELDKTRAECYYNLGNAFVIIQDYQNAIEPFKKACELDSQNVAALYNLGNAYLLTKDVQNAKKAFNEVMKIEPDNLEWRYRIAYVLDDNGETDLAYNIVEEGLKLKQDNSEMLLLKAQILEKRNDYKEAITVLESIKDAIVGEQKISEKIEALQAKLK